TCAALGVSFGGSGCTAVSGLRSVGIDRSPLLGFWDRSRPPSPGPGDDAYAQSMHASHDRADASAQRSDEARKQSGDDGRSDRDARGDEANASPNRAALARRSGTTAPAVRDEPARVTLG